jgi:hypothetical protein
VLEPTDLAVLDGSFTGRTAPWPQVLARIALRAVWRTHGLAHQTRVENRLLLLFWHLAQRWGRVGRDGVRLDLPLTHDVLGRLVGAQRPSVTTAFGILAERGVLARAPDRSWAPAADPRRGGRARDAPGAGHGARSAAGARAGRALLPRRRALPAGVGDSGTLCGVVSMDDLEPALTETDAGGTAADLARPAPELCADDTLETRRASSSRATAPACRRSAVRAPRDRLGDAPRHPARLPRRERARRATAAGAGRRSGARRASHGQNQHDPLRGARVEPEKTRPPPGRRGSLSTWVTLRGLCQP